MTLLRGLQGVLSCLPAICLTRKAEAHEVLGLHERLGEPHHGRRPTQRGHRLVLALDVGVGGRRG